MQRFSLHGKSALITGGARGIGLTCAKALAGAGASITLADRDEAKAQESAALLQAEFGVPALALAADVTDPASCAAMMDAAARAFGGIDIVLANAGISLPGVRLIDHTAEQWDAIFAVNVKGVFLTDQAAARAMIAQGRGGRIINMCSMTATVVSVHPYGSGGSYASSKAAVKQLTRAFAYDLASHNITVNSVSPGWLRTEMTQPIWDDPKNGGEKIARTPMGRPGLPEEICGAVLYLASGGSSFTTGSDLMIDGGFSIP